MPSRKGMCFLSSSHLLAALLLILSLAPGVFPACDLRQCSPPQAVGESVSCLLGGCMICPAPAEGVLIYTVPFNSTHCTLPCQYPLSLTGKAECSAASGDGSELFCDSLMKIAGYEMGFFKDMLGEVHNYTGICRGCSGLTFPNDKGDGCTLTLDSPVGVPQSPPPALPGSDTGCTDVSTCNYTKGAGSATFCWLGECKTCPGQVSGDYYNYQAPANATLCKPVCVAANTAEGVTECMAKYEQTSISKRFYCQSIANIPGYTGITSTFINRFGESLDYTGVCTDCGEGMVPNSFGTDCVVADAGTTAPSAAPYPPGAPTPIPISRTPPPTTASPPKSSGLCTNVRDCPLPQNPGSALFCYWGRCGTCPPRENGQDVYYTVPQNSTDCMPACTSPGTQTGLLECSAMYSDTPFRGFVYCEYLLNLPGYGAPTATYLDVLGQAYNFSGVCILCDPDNGLIPNSAGTACIPRTSDTAPPDSLAPSDAVRSPANKSATPPGLQPATQTSSSAPAPVAASGQSTSGAIPSTWRGRVVWLTIMGLTFAAMFVLLAQP